MSSMKKLQQEIFRIDLSPEELNAITAFLPAGYSFQQTPKVKKKQVHPVSIEKKKKKPIRESESHQKEESIPLLPPITPKQQKSEKKIPPKTVSNFEKVSKVNKKKKKNTSKGELADLGPVTLLEKKQLAQQIRRLGKEHIKGIASIVFDNAEEHEDKFDL